MNRMRTRRLLTWRSISAAATVTAAATVLSSTFGCFEENQNLGSEPDAGGPVTNHDSGSGSSATRDADSGIIIERPDSGTVASGGDAGETRTDDAGDMGDAGETGDDAGDLGRDGGAPPGDSGTGDPGDSGTTVADAGGPACPATQGTSGIVLASGQTNLASLAIDTANVYWTADVVLNTSGNVVTVPKSGGTPTQLATNQPSAFSIATAGSSLYWSTGTNNAPPGTNNVMRIMSLPEGSASGAIPSQFWGVEALQPAFPYGLVADSSTLYWWDLGASVFMGAPLDGSAASMIAGPFPVASAVPVGLAVDATNLYALSFGAPAGSQLTLSAMPKAGGTWSTLWSGTVGNSYSGSTLVADSTGVYWADLGLGAGMASGSIWSLHAGGGGTPTKIASGLNYPLELTGDGTNLYWNDAFALWSMPVAGGTPTIIAANQYAVGIRLDATNVYWADSCFGTVKKLAK